MITDIDKPFTNSDWKTTFKFFTGCFILFGIIISFGIVAEKFDNTPEQPIMKIEYKQ